MEKLVLEGCKENVAFEPNGVERCVLLFGVFQVFGEAGVVCWQDDLIDVNHSYVLEAVTIPRNEALF